MDRIDRLLSEVTDEIKKAGITPGEKISPTVVINGRAKSRFGCCKADKRTGFFTIELSEKMLNADEKSIKTVLAHEVLHTCRGCQNHGTIWKSHAARLNKNYGYNITVTEKPESYGLPAREKEGEVLYILKCTKCGLEVPRQKMSKVVKYPQNYRCSKCGGKIVRIK